MVLVVGADGDLGSMVSRILLRQGTAVRVLAPTPASCRDLVEAGAQLASDLNDRPSLDAACLDAHTVVNTSDTCNVADVARLIDAAQAATVEHFVQVSALAADINSPVRILAEKARDEERLESSGLPYTIIAAAALMEAWPVMLVGLPAVNGVPVTLSGQGTRKHSFISTANAAEFIAGVVNSPHALNRRLEIGGPEALSLRDVVAIYEWLLCRRIEVRTVEPGRPIPGLPAALWDMAASLEMFDAAQNTTATARSFGVRLTSFEILAKRLVAASERDC